MKNSVLEVSSSDSGEKSNEEIPENKVLAPDTGFRKDDYFGILYFLAGILGLSAFSLSFYKMKRSKIKVLR